MLDSDRGNDTANCSDIFWNLMLTPVYAKGVSMDWLRDLFRRSLSAKGIFFRRFRSSWLRMRWNMKPNNSSPEALPQRRPDDVLGSLDIVVINLDSRPDRLEEFKSEMARLGLHSWRRLSAVDGTKEYPELLPFYSGSIGCSLSHVLALRNAKWEKNDAILVCEDDVEFLVDKNTLSIVIQEFLENPRLDVLALYGKARGGSHPISSNLKIVVGMVGTVCYVAKPHMAEIISKLFIHGVANLMEGERRGKSDILWNQLQVRKYFFAAPIGSYRSEERRVGKEC